MKQLPEIKKPIIIFENPGKKDQASQTILLQDPDTKKIIASLKQGDLLVLLEEDVEFKGSKSKKTLELSDPESPVPSFENFNNSNLLTVIGTLHIGQFYIPDNNEPAAMILVQRLFFAGKELKRKFKKVGFNINRFNLIYRIGRDHSLSNPEQVFPLLPPAPLPASVANP